MLQKIALCQLQRGKSRHDQQQAQRSGATLTVEHEYRTRGDKTQQEQRRQPPRERLQHPHKPGGIQRGRPLPCDNRDTGPGQLLLERHADISPFSRLSQTTAAAPRASTTAASSKKPPAPACHSNSRAINRVTTAISDKQPPASMNRSGRQWR